MRNKRTILLLGLAVLMCSCHARSTGEWEKGMLTALKKLGHRNWILIADAAYPAYSSTGVEIILTEDDHFSVLKSTLKAIDKSGHVRPVIYLDKELASISDKQAPGISKFRKKLDSLLDKLEPRPLLHADLLERLDRTSETFRVLVLKTNMQLPYTSVFISLDCGYWSQEQERMLRQEMAKPEKPKRKK
jgi:L-fucose mutarotase/ribose pyranase (RbsD/FucU family)